MSLSLVVKNLGGQIKRFDQAYDRLPFDIQLGWMQRLGSSPFQLSITAWHLNKWSLPYYAVEDNGADWKNDAYGYAVMIDHGSGIETLYGHCSRLLVEEGQWVQPGDTVALVGSTGNSTGPHVHFEVRLNDGCSDPMLYLP